ncbi:MAG: AAA family ATPase [Candidatus Sericytochromatia bacterium]|nr:AAA family ATPase [Candidatus Sericytochromatia bacterium]
MSEQQPGVIDEIDIMIRARYPIIYVVSWEEKRVEQALLDIATRRNKKIFSWTITQGIVNLVSANATMMVNDSTRDPVSALEHLVRSVDSALFILKDFHPFMNDPTVIRKLRDLTIALKTSYKTILILSPTLKIPPELEKDITVVDFPLPGTAELGTLLDGIIFSVQGNKNVAVNLPPEGKEAILLAAQGLTLTEAESVFAKAIVSRSRIDPADIPIILSEKKQIIRKTGILEYHAFQEDIGDVGGLGNLKEWLRKRSLAFTEAARDYGLPQPKGILLLGVSGSGKSLVCKAVSSLWRLPLLRFDVGTVFSGLVGSSEENMRKAIRTAESVSPCLLWLDEMDKGLSGAFSSTFSDGGTTARVLSSFLTWMQEKTAPVFILATANDISALPPELLRKGRLDEIFFVDLPTVREREEIFSIHLRKRGRDATQFDMPLLAQMSNGFSGSEIEQAIISGLYDSFEAGRELVGPDIVNALRQSVPLSHTMREHIDALRTWAQTRARPASNEISVVLPH